VVWDLVPSRNGEQGPAASRKPDAQRCAIAAVEDYKEEIMEERKRQAAVKRKYGVKSLEYLIGDLDADLSELYERQERGEKVEIAIRSKEDRKKGYEKALVDLGREIEQEVSLLTSMPKFWGAVLVRPGAADDMVSDEEIERIGMTIAMDYERGQGRTPEDVSKESLGFDIRSGVKGELRYIEVKARKDVGSVALTCNEWFKAKRFRNQYWLYVVAQAKAKPLLYIVNNPYDNLKATEKVEVVRFMVPACEWKSKGKRA
jgi:hypothetical protein